MLTPWCLLCSSLILLASWHLQLRWQGMCMWLLHMVLDDGATVKLRNHQLSELILLGSRISEANITAIHPAYILLQTRKLHYDAKWDVRFITSHHLGTMNISIIFYCNLYIIFFFFFNKVVNLQCGKLQNINLEYGQFKALFSEQSVHLRLWLTLFRPC